MNIDARSDVLKVEGLKAGYGEENILHGISIRVPRRSIVAIIGPNGSGKSTLLKSIYGLVSIRGGSVTLFDAEEKPVSLVGKRSNAITALGMNMVPQLANVFADMTVLENLQMGSLPARHKYAERYERVLDALPLIKGMLSKRAATLSGGQRQMVAFGRALMSDPSLLLLDEPSAGLAPMVQEEIFSKTREINALGVSILMVEQRARQCLAIADYGYVLEQGRNRLEGTGAAMIDDPEVIRLYLGGGKKSAA
ncbi:ABC transporter ATP-binding protein [Kaistia dalseonensis]|uniref:ABC-type branched-subunit amino acid transport system ATPase component n=1 Tax=Kaistia dalseonensis TaxID=410840 RepID=A0ABU0H0V1_9HYPH|nr:ABC transporter ATP-binding protein [Kaistia dalseonensis]MCX5493381.1 ABC transporter ATP-binding protein [Kaistia dalseonensis]MDQ0435939.1 ABC-type branched-subunit amino acid transport system ATPase component [Kaistia dalseonensis]